MKIRLRYEETVVRTVILDVTVPDGTNLTEINGSSIEEKYRKKLLNVVNKHGWDTEVVTDNTFSMY